MPKVTNTRKERAAVLLDRASRGPVFDYPFDGAEFTPKEANRIYRNWVNSWIIPELRDLVPELRK